MERTRIINVLKVVLPIAALGLLSTLFLFSRDRDPLAELPVSQRGLEEGVREQRITAPEFSGMSPRGDAFTLRASSAWPAPDNNALALSQGLDARIDLVDGSHVDFASESGLYDSRNAMVVLERDVRVTTSTGYTVNTQSVRTSLQEVDVESAEITATGPLGEITAGAMQLTAEDGGGARLVFTKRVKLLYKPESE